MNILSKRFTLVRCENDPNLLDTIENESGAANLVV